MGPVPVIRSTRTSEQPLTPPGDGITGRSNVDPPARTPAGVWPDRHQLEQAARLTLNSLAVFALCGITGLAALATGPNLLGFDTVVVGSGSMEPRLQVADVVVLANPVDRRVVVGSVVNYRIDRDNRTGASAGDMRIHRVVEVVPDGGYRTKGDANPSADANIVDADRVTGVGIYVVPFVGRPRHWLATGQWLAISFAVLAAMALVFVGRDGFLDRPATRADERLGAVAVSRRSRHALS